MIYLELDSKLKHLIQVCKQTKNYKKLAVTGFILISNLLDEMGIKLGIRARLKNKEEKCFEYMRLINEVFETNLKIHIFKDSLIDTIKKYEILFLKSRGDVPLDYIQQIFSVYYELRKLDIPNLYEQLNEDNIVQNSNLNLYSFLSPRNSVKKKENNKLKPLILQKIKEKEIYLRESLTHEFNAKTLESAIALKKIKNGLEERNKGKIVIQGTLKDNINYQRSFEKLIGFLILGAFVVTLIFGFIILIETIFFSFTIGALSPFLLISFGPAALFFIIYWNYFRGL
ncbi:MAG: hypothetical protein ACFE9T_06070 [Promethearchaeota archaeon]